jgi:hypothetical protein
MVNAEPTPHGRCNKRFAFMLVMEQYFRAERRML